MKIMPVTVESDLAKIQEQMRKIEEENKDLVKIHSISENPIAFGLVAIEANLLFNDKQGGIEDIQEKILKIEGVGDAEVIDINRL